MIIFLAMLCFVILLMTNRNIYAINFGNYVLNLKPKDVYDLIRFHIE